MSVDNIESKVREMARLSILSGKICEIQENNLKLFPFVFFNDLSSVKIDYDLSHIQDADFKENKKNLDVEYSVSAHTKSRISYYLDVNSNQNNHLDKRFKALEDSVRNLFWKNIKVEVFINNKLSYESSDV